MRGNTAIGNAQWGFILSFASANTFEDNTTENNGTGFQILSEAAGNTFFHNNIIGNGIQAFDPNPTTNDWHEPVLQEGNFWSDYLGVDDGSGTGKHAIAGDRIGDTQIPHPGTDFDNFPFVVESGWVTVEDTTPPRCEVIGIIASELHVEVDDGVSGLASVNVLVNENATVNIPAFVQGTNDVVTVIGTKIDGGALARVQIEVFDVAGNRSECDPLLAVLDRSPSSPRFSTYDAIPHVDRYFTISNTGESIITYALLNVNGRWFIMPTLLPYEIKTIDIGSAMVAGAKNTVTVWGGGHGSQVMISDVMPTMTNTFAYPDEPLY